MSEINGGDSSFLDDLLENGEEVQAEQPAEVTEPEPVEAPLEETEEAVPEPVATETIMSGPGQHVQRGVATDADIVLAIDATGSMYEVIDQVKELAMTFNEKLYQALDQKQKMPRKIRMKVIGFRDYYYDIQPNPPIEQSDFFTILGNEDPAEDAQELQNFRDFVGSLNAAGGEDEPESGLEAIHLAIKSDWSNDPNAEKRRHIIVVFTDVEPHQLDDARRDDPNQNPGNNYPEDCPRDLSGLYSEYAGMETGSEGHTERRLFLFAPRGGIWEQINDEWDNVQMEAPQVVATQQVNGKPLYIYNFSATTLFTFLAGSM